MRLTIQKYVDLLKVFHVHNIMTCLDTVIAFHIFQTFMDLMTPYFVATSICEIKTVIHSGYLKGTP